MLFSLVVNATNLPPPGSVMPQDNDPITGSDKDTTTGNTGGFDTTPTLDTGTDNNTRDQFIVPSTKDNSPEH